MNTKIRKTDIYDAESLSWLRDIRYFVLDMDGTFYLENTIYPFSLEFLRRVESVGKHYLFFTNNSSRCDRDYIEKLAVMDCPITPDQILTSGDVTIEYLKKYYPGKSVYLLGTPALVESFREAGIHLTQEMPDLVVVGFDKTLDYEKLTKACTYIRKGAVFLATHPDINCPMLDGFIPDCGAFCAAISLSTGRQPRYLGKPQPETLEMVMEVTGAAAEEICFVGDRLYTDVATGVKNGAHGVLVLSGEATLADVETSDVKPDAIFRDLEELGEALLNLYRQH